MSNWHINEALISWRKLNEVLMQLTIQEIANAIEIEEGTRRRKTLIKRLASRLSAIKAEETRNELKEKLHYGSPKIHHHDR